LGHAHRLNQQEFEILERKLRIGIAERLSEVMRTSDVAMSELAAALGVNRSNVIRWTSGRELPSLRRLVSISAALHCPLHDLLPEPTAGLAWYPTVEVARD
jgi:transcriptional regulator with XRE-family HTH domain